MFSFDGEVLVSPDVFTAHTQGRSVKKKVVQLYQLYNVLVTRGISSSTVV